MANVAGGIAFTKAGSHRRVRFQDEWIDNLLKQRSALAPEKLERTRTLLIDGVLLMEDAKRYTARAS